MKRLTKLLIVLTMVATTFVSTTLVEGDTAQANTQCMNLKHHHWTDSDNQTPAITTVGGWPYVYAASRGKSNPFTVHQHATMGCPGGTSN